MSRKPKILVVGSFVMDLIVKTGHFPNAGETVLGLDYQTAPGGKGANQAVQAARLGAQVTMAGRVGDDDFGRRLIASCREAGVNTEFVSVDSTTYSAIGNVQLEVQNGITRNRIIVVSGANMATRPEDVAFLKDSIAEYDMVMLQLEIPMQINELVAAYAYEKNVPVMLNSAPSAPLSDELLSHLTYISPNEHEAADLTDIPIRKDGKQVNMDDVHKAADTLLAKGVKNVVITLGNAGAVVANKEAFLYEPCIDVVEVKDPTAAGDSFVGAFTASVCAGLSHKDALHFANYTATLTVSRMGAQPSLPKLEEVIALMQQENDLTFSLSALDGLK
ncbi:ribokinase [Faecalispora jeddahensis]|uniref:ribokinase n=1 Tax=Faecalispora jeddahensis TaxID=1414721 RepID=UPI00189B953F|nr:ribokinase [Faecalispora jeddahensis]